MPQSPIEEGAGWGFSKLRTCCSVYIWDSGRVGPLGGGPCRAEKRCLKSTVVRGSFRLIPGAASWVRVSSLFVGVGLFLRVRFGSWWRCGMIVSLTVRLLSRLCSLGSFDKQVLVGVARRTTSPLGFVVASDHRPFLRVVSCDRNSVVSSLSSCRFCCRCLDSAGCVPCSAEPGLEEPL